MKQILRFFILFGFVVAPFVGKAGVTAHFTSNYTPGCLNSVTFSSLVTFSDASTTSGGSLVYYQYVVSYDSASVAGDTINEGTFTGASASYTFTDTGWYSVTETVVNSLGDTGRTTQSYYIAPEPAVRFTTTNPAADLHACPGHVVTFVNTSDTVAGCSPTFTWNIESPSGGTASFTTTGRAATITYTFTATGSYNVYLIENTCTPNACINYTVQASYINIDAIPVACFTNNDSVACTIPSTVAFNNCSSGATTYRWSFGDGSTSTLANPSHTYTAIGTPHDTLIAYSFAGCPDTLAKTGNIIVTNFIPAFTVSANTICQSNTITTGTITYSDVTTGATTHSWSDNYTPAHTSALASPTFTYITPGTYTVTETAGNAAGCSGVVTHTVSVLAAPTAAFTADTLYKCTPNLTANFTATFTPSASVASYEWFFGSTHLSALDSSNALSPTHVYTANGTYTDSLRVTGTDGCSSMAVRTAYIKIAPSTFNINAPIDSGCVPFNMVYNTSVTSAPAISYTVTFINFGDGTTVSLPGTTGAHTYLVGGSYTVTAHYVLPDSAGGCTYTSTTTVKAGAVHPSFTPIVSADTACPNASVTFNGNCASCGSFIWNFNNPTFPAASNVNSVIATHSSPNGGTFYIGRGIGDEAGCTDTTYDTVQVLEPAASFTSSVNCTTPHTVYFNNSVSAASGATGYSWTFGDGATASGSNPTHTYAAYNTYTVTMVDSATTGTHQCTNTYSLVINVFPLIDSFHVADSVICHGTAASFTGVVPSYGGTYSSYIWRFGDGTTATTATNTTTHIYPTNGHYTDTLIIVNSYGCRDTADNIHVTVTGPTGGITESAVLGCAPLTVNFTDNNTDYTGYSIYTHHWTFNAPPSATGAGSVIPTTPIHVIGTPVGSGDTSVVFPEGVYHIVLTDTDNNHNHCFVIDTVTIRSQKPHAYFTSVDSGKLACTGVPITFNDTNTHCTYTWNFGDGTTGTGQNPTHIYSVTGSYTVSVTITTTAGGTLPVGCQDTYVADFSINIGHINPSFTLSSTFAPCPPLGEFGTNTTTPLTNYTYQWRVNPFGEIVPTIGYTFFDVLNYTSTITLIATDPFTGCKDSSSQVVTINGPTGTVSVTNDSGCAPVTSILTFTSTGGTAPSTVTWSPGDGNTYPSSPLTITHTYVDSGTFHPYVTISGGGCVVTIPAGVAVLHTDSVQVFPEPTIKTSNDTFVCHGTTATISASGAMTDGNYSWSPAGSLDCSTCYLAHATPSVTTTYTVTGVTIHGCSGTATVTVTVDTAIAVTITGRDSICSGLCDTLSVSGGVLGGYTFTPPLSPICPTCDSFSACPPLSSSPQNYVVVYTDAHNCSATNHFMVSVNPLPGAITGNTNVCVRDSTKLTNAPGGSWSSSNTTIATVGSTGMVYGAGAGTATITYTNGTGCIVTTLVTVHPSPGLIGGPTDVCVGATIEVTDTPGTGTWSIVPAAGTATITGAAGIGTITGVAAGTATISYTLPGGCASISDITVHPLPVLAYAPNPAFVCRGSSQLLSVSGASTYMWSPSFYLSSDSTGSVTITGTPAAASLLSYTVAGTSAFGCVSHIVIPVTVYDSTITSISNDTTICIGKSVQLQATSSEYALFTAQYSWAPVDGSLNCDNCNNPLATPLTTTTYTVSIVENPCFSAERDVTITVIPSPQISIAVVPAVSTIIAGTSVQLIATVTNSVTVNNWAWAPSNTLSCDTCYNPIATPTNTTTYSIIGTTPIGCNSQESVTINVICVEASQVFVPNTFTPNGDGNNDRFYLSGKGLGLITRMSVYNRWGEKVFEAENINANDPGAGWDGTYRGQILQPDVFVYVFDLLCETGVPFTLKGDVSIVR